MIDNARLKALDVYERLAKNKPERLIIGCDTVVTIDGCIIEKPKDSLDAFSILKRSVLLFSSFPLIQINTFV